MIETLLTKLSTTGASGAAKGAGVAGASQSFVSGMSTLGPLMGVLGAIQSGFGSYYQARSLKSNLKYQSGMAAINSRLAERTAQSILQAGEQAQGLVSMRAGKVKAAQKVSQAARGVQIGVGSAAEEIATTDLMKEIDMMTINSNAVREAEAARMQAVNYGNEALMSEAAADGVNPYASGVTSLIDSGTSVAMSWYRGKQSQGMYDDLNSKLDTILSGLPKAKGGL